MRSHRPCGRFLTSYCIRAFGQQRTINFAEEV